jgi:hypothetical protein
MRLPLTVGTVVLLGACGGSYPVTLTASPSSGPAEAMECTRAKLKELRYQPTSFDETDLRLTAQKVDNTVSRADPQYRRHIDRVEVTTAAEADGRSSLKVVGHTFAEYQTHRGPTEQEERASAGVRESAQAILKACAAS